MAIAYLHIITKTAEVITLKDVESICIGKKDNLYMSNDEFIFITSSKGKVEFKTNQLSTLDFFIVDEEANTCLPVISHGLDIYKREERGEEGCKDTKDAL